MITYLSDITPEMYDTFVNTKFQPSWYKGERYDYVEQLPVEHKKEEKGRKRSFLRRDR